MDQSVALISEAKAAVEDPTAPNKQLRLAQAAKAVSQALNQVVNCMPEVIVFDQAIKSIAQSSLALQSGKVRREEEKEGGEGRRGREGGGEGEKGGQGNSERVISSRSSLIPPPSPSFLIQVVPRTRHCRTILVWPLQL